MAFWNCLCILTTISLGLVKGEGLKVIPIVNDRRLEIPRNGWIRDRPLMSDGMGFFLSPYPNQRFPPSYRWWDGYNWRGMEKERCRSQPMIWWSEGAPEFSPPGYIGSWSLVSGETEGPFLWPLKEKSDSMEQVLAGYPSNPYGLPREMDWVALPQENLEEMGVLNERNTADEINEKISRQLLLPEEFKEKEVVSNEKKRKYGREKHIEGKDKFKRKKFPFLFLSDSKPRKKYKKVRFHSNSVMNNPKSTISPFIRRLNIPQSDRGFNIGISPKPYESSNQTNSSNGRETCEIEELMPTWGPHCLKATSTSRASEEEAKTSDSSFLSPSRNNLQDLFEVKKEGLELRKMIGEILEELETKVTPTQNPFNGLWTSTADLEMSSEVPVEWGEVGYISDDSKGIVSAPRVRMVFPMALTPSHTNNNGEVEALTTTVSTASEGVALKDEMCQNEKDGSRPPSLLSALNNFNKLIREYLTQGLRGMQTVGKVKGRDSGGSPIIKNNALGFVFCPLCGQSFSFTARPDDV